MEPLIEWICDEHVTADEVGPLITRIEGVWAYCAGNGGSGHEWRRIPPTKRDALPRVSTMEPQDKAAG